MLIYPYYDLKHINIYNINMKKGLLDVGITKENDEIFFCIDTTTTGNDSNSVKGTISIENAEKVIAEIQEFIQRVKIQQFISENVEE